MSTSVKNVSTNFRVPQILCIIIGVNDSRSLVNAGKVRHHNLIDCEPDAMHSLYSPLQPPESLRGIR